MSSYHKVETEKSGGEKSPLFFVHRRNMRFCHIKEDYITFLRNYDTKVAENKNESRPYVGVVLQIGTICYYAPFTSPKAKHQKMKNGKDFRKIGQGKYGAINFNNMIPVPNSAILFMEIENETNPQYKRLLQNQYNAVKADWNNIQRTAEKLRELVVTDDSKLSSYDRSVKSRCCNLALLESVYRNYER